jgi:hypothetical protein
MYPKPKKNVVDSNGKRCLESIFDGAEEEKVKREKLMVMCQ